MSDENFYFGRLNNVSVEELDAALASTIGITASARARHMFGAISNRKKALSAEEKANLRLAEAASEYNPTFTFTAGELDKSLQRLEFIPWPGLPAILKDIKDHREPEWKARDIVTDINRRVYIMQQSGRWKSVQDAVFVPFDRPERPLTKIGVEGL
jgi:hypothetical protein